MVKRIDILKENKVYENKYGCLYDDDVEFSHNKTIGTYVRWKWNAPYSVAVLPMFSKKEFGLIENFRHSARKSVLEVPKGFGDIGVEPKSVALKELEEETGLKSKIVYPLGVTVTDPAFLYHTMHLFIAWDCYEGVSNNESSESIIGMRRFKTTDLQTIMQSGEIQDAVTLLLISIAIQKEQEK